MCCFVHSVLDHQTIHFVIFFFICIFLHCLALASRFLFLNIQLYIQTYSLYYTFFLSGISLPMDQVFLLFIIVFTKLFLHLCSRLTCSSLNVKWKILRDHINEIDKLVKENSQFQSITNCTQDLFLWALHHVCQQCVLLILTIYFI